MKKFREYLDTLTDSVVQREKIEWSNTWIDNVADMQNDRYLFMGDSVLRMVRKRVSEKTG